MSDDSSYSASRSSSPVRETSRPEKRKFGVEELAALSQSGSREGRGLADLIKMSTDDDGQLDLEKARLSCCFVLD